MAKNKVQSGDILDLVAPSGGVVSGTPYQIGQIVCVALTDAAVGETFAGAVVGVWEVAKLSAQAWTVGDLVYFDAGNDRFTTVASGNQLAGVAVKTAANPSATGTVRLNGAFRPDEA
jgi:predicted RecA/RadA family phage recombinase